jgi:hypothetical protein
MNDIYIQNFEYKTLIPQFKDFLFTIYKLNSSDSYEDIYNSFLEKFKNIHKEAFNSPFDEYIFNNQTLVVCFSKTEIYGYLSIKKLDNNIFELYNICTSSQYRNQGVLNRLMNYIYNPSITYKLGILFENSKVIHTYGKYFNDKIYIGNLSSLSNNFRVIVIESKLYLRSDQNGDNVNRTYFTELSAFLVKNHKNIKNCIITSSMWGVYDNIENINKLNEFIELFRNDEFRSWLKLYKTYGKYVSGFSDFIY